MGEIAQNDISDKSDKPVVKPKKVECMPKKQVVLAAVDEILTYSESKRTSCTNKGKSTSQMPKHLSSDQFIEYLTKRKKRKLLRKKNRRKGEKGGKGKRSGKEASRERSKEECRKRKRKSKGGGGGEEEEGGGEEEELVGDHAENKNQALPQRVQVVILIKVLMLTPVATL